ncbi:MAG: mviN [Amycolatopsis sp.]|uniref:murein biosynthesis integral membrane protein MurJ n=1 Tax=Amycolatopsis sp. TaxID=37632 RepID=UPI00261CC28A|nr:murein biosynthesis integral membrane protein MurJ [Amycolatopsis sp.]MCU1681350.1 mviN [Amycolatopsis sp.]
MADDYIAKVIDDEPTVFIPRDRGLPIGVRWPTNDPDVRRPYSELASTVVFSAVTVGGPAPAQSLAKSSGRIAIASLTSRITGFGWKIALVMVVGAGAVNDAFNVANTLPNIVFELLLGGVLSSVVVPLLVRSHDDPDGGQAYAQRLITMALVLLAVGTVVAVAAAPWFTSLYVDKSANPTSRTLTTAFAYLLLPQILFYGMFALLSAILNAKNVFGPPAWAPVLNNLVVLVTLAMFWLVPGQISLNPARMGDAHVLVLGCGVTLGIVAQAVTLIPPLLRSGFRFKWRWGIDPRMKEFAGLAAWILAYVGVSQVGLVVNTRVLTGWGVDGSVTAYTYAWLLFQLPYGVIGVSLLTALMPRLSRAAADGDTAKMVGDLSYASRISTVLLLPIAAVLAVGGTPIGIAVFSHNGLEAGNRLGETLAISALGLLPYAMVLLQLRVFYAMKDARTPTLIALAMTAVKIPLLYLCPALLGHDQVVLGAMLVNALSFVVGAVLGQVWLWVRLGHLRSRRALRVVLFTAVAGGVGALAAYLVGLAVPGSFGALWQAWVRVPVEGLVGVGVAFGLLAASRMREFAPVTRRVTALWRQTFASS